MKCQKITSRGPCRRNSSEGSHYCSLHAKNEDLITAYKLTSDSLNEDVRHHARASLADLSQQVVLMRAIVQRRLNLAGDNDAEQIAAMNFASTQLASIVKSTEVMVKLAREAGELMSRIEVEEFVDGVVTIVADELQAAGLDEAIVDKIAGRIGEEFED